MFVYLKTGRLTKTTLIVAFSVMVMLTLCGFQHIEIKKKIMQDGVQYDFEGRIIEEGVAKVKRGQQRFFVEKIPVTDPLEKRIYVLVDSNTSSSISLKKLSVEMRVAIEGLKIIEEANDQKIILVYAKSIRPILE